MTVSAEGQQEATALSDAAAIQAALVRIVDALWSEFGDDLIEGENDAIDQAYHHACDVLGVPHDRRSAHSGAYLDTRNGAIGPGSAT